MSNIDIREKSKQLRKLKEERELIEERYLELKARIERTTSTISDMPKGQGVNMDYWIAEKDALERAYIKKLLEHIQCSIEMVKYIVVQNDSLLRMTLMYRYIDFKTWEEVAEKLDEDSSKLRQMCKRHFDKEVCGIPDKT